MSENREQLLLELGCIMREARRAKGFTVEKLAEQIGVSKRFISSIESGERAPGYENLRALIHCLGISADQIFYPNLAEDTDAQQVMRRYGECSDHDKQIVKAVIEAALQSE